LFSRESLTDLNAQHPLGDAFFDYNQTDLRDDARRALQQDAAWLAKWPTTKILVEGHCDERGTAEYNLALGDRRAKEVTQYLERLGISPSRITSDSLGKEKPFCSGDTESCWAQNRRGHFVVTAK
jgi:peptidoglycan-associated lipoprotein